MSRISIDTSRCTGDELCARDCVARCLRMKDGKAWFPAHAEQACIGCGHCFAICPAAAITLDDMAPAQADPVSVNPVSPDDLDMLFRSRRSVRLFRKGGIPEDVLKKAIDTARYAPTAVNRQNLSWTVVQSPEMLRSLAQATADTLRAVPELSAVCQAHDAGNDVFLRNAPCAVFVDAPEEPAGLQPQDATIALTFFESMLASMGYGTTWAGYIVTAAALAEHVRTTLGIPAGRRIVAGCMAGKPAVRYQRIPPRKPASARWI